jgi:hypothetical protein
VRDHVERADDVLIAPVTVLPLALAPQSQTGIKSR